MGHHIIDFATLGALYPVFVAQQFARYLLIAGPAYLVLWVWKRRAWFHRKIQQIGPNLRRIRTEFAYSSITLSMFGGSAILLAYINVNGYTHIYWHIADYGWAYFFVSILGMVAIHDTYFYWTHRLLHWKPLLKRVHRVHHASTDPSPFAAYAFHPVESAIQAGVAYVISFGMPFHPAAIGLFLLLETSVNVTGHSGYEFFPAGFTTHPVTKWFNTATHHNMHHKNVQCNYGLYFNFWDRVMGTNHRTYHQRFEAVKARQHAHIAAMRTGAALARAADPPARPASRTRPRAERHAAP